MWTYRCYDDGGQLNLWRRWYDNTPDAQGSHDAIFGALEQTTQWKKPWTDFLDKQNRLIEVRLSGKVQWRILGFYGAEPREFIVVATCFHKQRVYTPPSIKETALRRKKEIESDPRKAPLCARPK